MGVLHSIPFVVRRWLCAAHLALIAVLSLLPSWLFPPSATQVPGMDKVVHVGMYGLLGGLLRWAVVPNRDGRSWAGWPMLAIGYGLLMEVLQLALSGGGRSFSWADALANAVGVVVAWLGMGWVLARGKMRED